MKKKQIENQAQQGRSMVEMLGVLAIVGVISIGGISGYRWGMNKHITNQILYEMNLNSAQLAMLLQKGNPEGVTLSLGSPYDDENPTFSTVNYGFDYGCGENDEEHKCAPNETMYSMTAIGLPKRICNMLNDSVFGMAYYYNHKINGDENNECDDDERGNTVTVFFETDTMIDGEISRPEEPETHYTPEVTTTTTTPQTTTPPATTPEATTTQVTTTTEASTTTQATTTTLTTTTIGDKTCPTGTNEECMRKLGTGYFCKSSGCSYKCTGRSSISGTMTEEDSCKDGTYNCEKIDSYKADNNDTVDSKNPYILSKSNNLNWWSAERFCNALGKHMVKISDLDCCNPNLGGTTTGYCYAKKEEGTCNSSNGLSDKIKALRRAKSGGTGLNDSDYSGRLWLYDPYTSTTAGRNSCLAYYVDLNNGNVYHLYSTSNLYALCGPEE